MSSTGLDPAGVELAADAGASAPSGSPAPASGDAPRAPRPGWVPYAAVGLVALTVVVLLALFVWGLARKEGGFAGFAVNTVGQLGRLQPGPAPDFEVRLLSGGAFRLSEQRGKLVLVNFWASWCPPCRDEAPTLERAWQRYRGRGVVLVGLDVWDGEQDARDFLRRFGVTYPNGPDTDGSAAIGYGLTGIPETYFIRPDGTMARHWVGPLTDQQIEAFIEELLP